MKKLIILTLCLSFFGFTGFSTNPNRKQPTQSKVYHSKERPRQQWHQQYKTSPQKTIQQKRQEEMLENQRRIINNQEDMQRLQDQQRSWDFINRRNR